MEEQLDTNIGCQATSARARAGVRARMSAAISCAGGQARATAVIVIIIIIITVINDLLFVSRAPADKRAPLLLLSLLLRRVLT